ncbi:hypothetical protein ACFX19_029616 [Malus domestica]
MDMVRSMICRTNLPSCLWGEAVKTTNYILNRVPSKSVEGTPFELWTGRKPSLNHLHVWGCRAEAKIYNPGYKKLDSKTVSCHFIGYAERSKGFRFYCPNQNTRIVEIGKAVFMESNASVDSGTKVEGFVFEEEINNKEAAVENVDRNTTIMAPIIVVTENMGSNDSDEPCNEIEVAHDIELHDNTVVQDVFEEAMTENQQQQHHAHEDNITVVGATNIRRSSRVRKPTTLNDFVYLTQVDTDLSEFNDPLSYKEAIAGPDADKWIEAMKSELSSMANNQVWDLVEQAEGTKPIGCKWFFKTKRDSNGNIERHKVRLVAKGFT